MVEHGAIDVEAAWPSLFFQAYSGIGSQRIHLVIHQLSHNAGVHILHLPLVLFLADCVVAVQMTLPIGDAVRDHVWGTGCILQVFPVHTFEG